MKQSATLALRVAVEEATDADEDSDEVADNVDAVVENLFVGLTNPPWQFIASNMKSAKTHSEVLRILTSIRSTTSRDRFKNKK